METLIVILVIAWMIGNAFYTISILRKLRLERMAHQQTASRLQHYECDPMHTNQLQITSISSRLKRLLAGLFRRQ